MKADTLLEEDINGFSGSVSNSFDAHPGATLTRIGPSLRDDHSRARNMSRLCSNILSLSLLLVRVAQGSAIRG